MKIAIPVAKKRRRPWMSESLPQIGTLTVDASVYAVKTHE